MRIHLFAALLLLVISGPASAVTVDVYTSQTLFNAAYYAMPGDEIVIRVPELTGAFYIPSSNVTVKSPGGTTIRPEGPYPIFTIVGAENVTLQNLRIESYIKSYFPNGAALASGLHITEAFVILRDCEITGLSSIVIDESNLFAERVKCQGISGYQCIISMTDSEVIRADRYLWDTAAIDVHDSFVALKGCRIKGIDGGDDSIIPFGGSGGAGMKLSYTTAILHGSTIEAGVHGLTNGAPGIDGNCLDLFHSRVINASSSIVLIDPANPNIRSIESSIKEFDASNQ